MALESPVLPPCWAHPHPHRGAAKACWDPFFHWDLVSPAADHKLEERNEDPSLPLLLPPFLEEVWGWRLGPPPWWC